MQNAEFPRKIGIVAGFLASGMRFTMIAEPFQKLEIA